MPLKTFPNTYNGHPLCCAALAAQKNHNSLYLMAAYGNPKQAAALRDGFRQHGLKLDMGKSCVRFKTLEDLPLDVIGAVIASMPPQALIDAHESVHGKKRAAPVSQTLTVAVGFSRKAAARRDLRIA